ncbi:hypothetical protein EV426DRAFT_250758 [Tirmania nivea]|nr:hypothetical protein EV426DRAFT_250758 [Tirmania nivea]
MHYAGIMLIKGPLYFHRSAHPCNVRPRPLREPRIRKPQLALNSLTLTKPVHAQRTRPEKYVMMGYHGPSGVEIDDSRISMSRLRRHLSRRLLLLPFRFPHPTLHALFNHHLPYHPGTLSSRLLRPLLYLVHPCLWVRTLQRRALTPHYLPAAQPPNSFHRPTCTCKQIRCISVRRHIFSNWGFLQNLYKPPSIPTMPTQPPLGGEIGDFHRQHEGSVGVEAGLGE